MKKWGKGRDPLLALQGHFSAGVPVKTIRLSPEPLPEAFSTRALRKWLLHTVTAILLGTTQYQCLLFPRLHTPFPFPASS